MISRPNCFFGDSCMAFHILFCVCMVYLVIISQCCCMPHNITPLHTGHSSCLGFDSRCLSAIKAYPWECNECKLCWICDKAEDDEKVSAVY